MNKINFDDTIAAPATIPGTGAISVIRVSGPSSFAIADKVISIRSGLISEAAGYTIKFGVAHYPDGRQIDDVLVSVFRSPHSYTGEDSAEISCHASKFVAEELMLQLVSAGARVAEPGEFTRRAYVNGKMDLAQAESVADLISSTSSASHRIAMNQLRGGFSKELLEMRAQLLDMTSLMELELDFSEEDVEFADRSRLNSLLDEVLAHVSRLADSFRLGNAIKNGIPVAIVGATNSGKSTLLNALLGEDRAIVSDVEGTTRDTIEETLNIDGVLFRLIDTAGLRETSETVEKIGIERTYEKISKADIVIDVVDSTLPSDEINAQVSAVLSKVDRSSQKFILLFNKSDVSGCNIDVSAGVDVTETLEISAKEGTGIPELKIALKKIAESMITVGDQTLVTNLRHYQALSDARLCLQRVKEGLATSLPTDLVAQDLRDSITALGSITGMSIDTEEVLGNIFSRFCIGK